MDLPARNRNRTHLRRITIGLIAGGLGALALQWHAAHSRVSPSITTPALSHTGPVQTNTP